MFIEFLEIISKEEINCSGINAAVENTLNFIAKQAKETIENHPKNNAGLIEIIREIYDLYVVYQQIKDANIQRGIFSSSVLWDREGES